ncbi:hypothetical protein AK830_g8196 [Neonectria ditissima]|uniref:Fungal N-terminal domain-containing protein n=1 Tax=Neonectria ditissima TaxID=78410 RepID=A0A0P7AKT8_9HYPO|nr:hypothetical protein AK830_g8196 [Neonectria ditissima]
MDPASIVGLIATGCKLSLILYEVTHTVVDAPKKISSIRAEISALDVALGQLDGWVAAADPKTVSSSIEDDVSEIITACQETYAGLEELISKNPQPPLWTRIMWIKNGPDTVKLLRRVESHKVSLNLILTAISSRTNVRIEDRLVKTNYIMRHVAKSQQKISRKHKARNTERETTPNTVQAQSLSGLAIASPIHLNDLATPSASQTPAVEAQAIDPYVMMSADQDARRNSTGTQYTANTVTGTIITRVTDLSINDLDVEDLLRPLSEPLQLVTITLDSAAVTSVNSTSVATPDLIAVTTLSTGLDQDSLSRLQRASTRPQPPVTRRKQETSITLSHILEQKTRSPYSLFDLYVYMRYRGTEDNLDF